MTPTCACDRVHPPKLVVVTGGPGAGKTALLEVVQRQLCNHIVVLPEAASILWTGGFPRHTSLASRRGAQRAIVRLQHELQRIAIEEASSSLILCDRGSLDGLAYWPSDEREFFTDLDMTRDEELARYAAVIHLQTPTREGGYRPSAVRTESAEEAEAIDKRLLAAWSAHPHRSVVPSNSSFLSKMSSAIELVRAQLPACCR